MTDNTVNCQPFWDEVEKSTITKGNSLHLLSTVVAYKQSYIGKRKSQKKINDEILTFIKKKRFELLPLNNFTISEIITVTSRVIICDYVTSRVILDLRLEILASV